MSRGINKFIGIGNLTADPELKFTESGTARCRFAIAINRKYTKSDGELVEDVTFVPIVAWGKLAEACAEYLEKGRQAYVEGRLDIRSWETQEGEKRKATEIIAQTVNFLGGRGNGNGNSAPAESTDISEPSAESTDEGPEVPF